MIRLTRRLGWATRIICALSLLFAGLVHQPARAMPAPAHAAQQPDLSAYALPDGTLPVLCRPALVTDEDGQAALADSCDACRLAAAALVPGPPGFGRRGDVPFIRLCAIKPGAPGERLACATALARAPPPRG